MYDPSYKKLLNYCDAIPAFKSGQDNPSQFLERCLDSIAQRDIELKAWVILNEENARKASAESTKRWKNGNPISLIDGMPIGIKDLIETKDMPTQMGCAAMEGNFPKRDSALVRALRDAGAVIIGKCVTTELGGANPSPTTNPYDITRTPGGSSSGSAAAVGAGMIPVAIGTQVGGSVIRPASYCGNWGLKVTLGALNRGERLGYSHSVIGIHANSPIDMWRTGIEIAKRAGGDPGHPGLFGPMDAPQLLKPQRLIVMETSGWNSLPDSSVKSIDYVISNLKKLGVEIIRRSDSSLVEAFEKSIESMKCINNEICAFELRWSLENLIEQHPGKLSKHAIKKLESGRKMSLEDYRLRLLERDDARRRLEQISPIGDALLSLSATGAAPINDFTGQRPTGDAVFNHPSSSLGAPAVTIPLLAVDNMPLGIQIMGQPNTDAKILGISRWLASNIESQSY